MGAAIRDLPTQARRYQERTTGVRWSPDGGHTVHEVVRQQWSFSPHGATGQTEDQRVDLTGVTVLELSIVPDMGGGPAHASLARPDRPHHPP